MTRSVIRRTAALCAALTLSLTGCSPAREPVVASAPPLPTAITAPSQTLPSVAEEELIPLDAFNQFAIRLFQSQNQEENWAVSPVNVAVALGQLRCGAQEETAAQLDSVLGLTETCTQEQVWASLVRLRAQLESLAPDSLWQSWGLAMGEGPSVRVQYADLLMQSLGSRVELVDYETEDYADTYTAWVKTATGGLVTELESAPVENASVSVMAAAALDGKWAKAFNPENIRNASFTQENGQKIGAPMMTTKASAAVVKNEEVTFASLDMEGKLEAWLMLPPEGMKLGEFVRNLTLEKVMGWRKSAVTEYCLVTVPRVDITSQMDVLSGLKAMGLEAAADPEQADFSNMGENITLSSVLTACRLRLGEHGLSEADEAMSQRMLRGMDREMVSYAFDRPYVMAVVDTSTDSLVILAAVTRPAPAES